MKRAPLLVLGTSLLLVMALGIPALAWQFGVVDSADTDAPPSSLAISSSDSVYVVWDKAHQDELWSAKWTGSSWAQTKVRSVIGVDCYDDHVGPVVAFKPGAGERIASACNDAEGSSLFWSSYGSGQWTTSTVASLPHPFPWIGFYVNLDVCFDPSTKQPSTFFGDTNGLFVDRFYYSGGVWHEENVTAPVALGNGLDGPAVSCAYSPTGQLAVASIDYRYGGGGLSYGTYASGTWTFSGLGVSNAIGIPSLAFAPDRTPWIAFQRGTASASHLEVGHLENEVWTFTSVDSSSAVTGVAPSLAFKGSLARVAYYDQTNGNLRWATYSGTSWSTSTLDSSGDRGNHPSLAYSSVQKPYISYWDATKKDVRWARPT